MVNRYIADLAEEIDGVDEFSVSGRVSEIQGLLVVCDAVRGILDGHIVMERAIAERGRYPAINVLRSISRTMPNCNTEDENQLVSRARSLMATYSDMEDMIRLGAYRRGSDPQIDEAIEYHDALEGFLAQNIDESCSLTQGYGQLKDILDRPQPEPAPEATTP